MKDDSEKRMETENDIYIYGMKEYKVAKERFVFNRSIIISSRFVEFKNGSREVVRKRTRRESNCKY